MLHTANFTSFTFVIVILTASDTQDRCRDHLTKSEESLEWLLEMHIRCDLHHLAESSNTCGSNFSNCKVYLMCQPKELSLQTSICDRLPILLYVITLLSLDKLLYHILSFSGNTSQLSELHCQQDLHLMLS